MNEEQGPSWSDIADWYDDLLISGSGPHDTALQCTLSLLPKIAGQAVLDLACDRVSPQEQSLPLDQHWSSESTSRTSRRPGLGCVSQGDAREARDDSPSV